MSDSDRVREHAERAQQGNLAKEGEKLARQNKLFVRDRVRLLLDPDSFVEDGLLANALAGDLPADGVVTGVGRIEGRPVCVMANDPTVKAGSWGKRTVEKIPGASARPYDRCAHTRRKTRSDVSFAAKRPSLSFGP